VGHDETGVGVSRVRSQSDEREQTGDDVAEASLSVIEVRSDAPGFAAQRDRPPVLSTHVLTLDFAMDAGELRDERIVEGEVGRRNGTQDDEIVAR
jgi:hypothetical protein